MAIAQHHNSAKLQLCNSLLTTLYSPTPTTTTGTSSISLRASQEKFTNLQLHNEVTSVESAAATRKALKAKTSEPSIKRALPPLSTGQDRAKDYQPGQDGAKNYPHGAALLAHQSGNDSGSSSISAKTSKATAPEDSIKRQVTSAEDRAKNYQPRRAPGISSISQGSCNTTTCGPTGRPAPRRLSLLG
jgi:hypothetical protein